MRSLVLRAKPYATATADWCGQFTTTPTKALSPFTSKRSPSLSPTALSFRSDDDNEAKPIPSLRLYFGVVVWLTLSAWMLWYTLLPKATQWWIDLEDSPIHSTMIKVLDIGLPGGYTSQEEMESRSLRFPGVAQRVKVYMSHWYLECSVSSYYNTSSTVKYTYVQDSEDQSPLLLIREKPSWARQGANDSFVREVYSDKPRTFVLDSAIVEKGARVFYMRADEIRRCDDLSCKDMVQYIFPSLHRTDMAPSARNGYVGNALDALDGNRNGVVPIILQFGDMEVSRAFVPLSHRNETYPVVPIFKKFRKSMSMEDLEAITTGAQCAKSIPYSEPPMNPIISKLTYKRHFGMLDEIQAADLPWHDKYDMAVFRGALTGMKRDGFRVVQNLATHTKQKMCLEIQRCRLVYLHRNSELVNASLVDVMSEHPNNLISDPVVPSILNGVSMFGQRLTYAELLKYKAVIMLEGNGLKWALYSNSVVLMPQVTYTSWAMEELLEPWVHFVPISNSLADVEEKVQWIIENPDQAQAIAHAGKLWISDLVYHPYADDDDNAIIHEMFLRYKKHFGHEPDLASYDNLALNLAHV